MMNLFYGLNMLQRFLIHGRTASIGTGVLSLAYPLTLLFFPTRKASLPTWIINPMSLQIHWERILMYKILEVTWPWRWLVNNSPKRFQTSQMKSVRKLVICKATWVLEILWLQVKYKTIIRGKSKWVTICNYYGTMMTNHDLYDYLNILFWTQKYHHYWCGNNGNVAFLFWVVEILYH